MRERVDKKTRSMMMKSVKSKNTLPEMTVRKAAYKLGLRFRLHSRVLPGKPDLVFKKHKTVIFVNGCFWHMHDCNKGRMPTSNQDFWFKKLNDNARRDKDNLEKLESMGWRVITIWECQITKSEDASRILNNYFFK